MSTFLPSEKPRQTAFKATHPSFSPAARAEGVYKGTARPFCLPLECAAENLYPGIRQPALAYFARNQVKWHDGQGGNPSNHLCDSQVCCVNFLFPFYNQPESLAALLGRRFEIAEMLPIEDGQFVSFEWIGAENYLQEKITRTGKRSRGANFTSADAAVMFRRPDGKKQIVLIEWKYTESYSSTWLRYAPSGTDRTTIYHHLWDADDCPLNTGLILSFDDLFYEPFYQFMRQQFLAHEMEKAHELGADVVSLLHISPAHNEAFGRVTSPGLCSLGHPATTVWKKLVKHPDRFLGEYTENIFDHFPVQDFPQMEAWWGYISERYGWLVL